MKILDKLRQTQQAIVSSLSVFVRDVGHGLLEVSHNSLAILGLVMVAALVFAAGRADLREEAEVIALDWLQSRHEDRAAANGADETRVGIADQDGVSRATAADPRELTSQQALVARWITRRYKVAPEPISRLVQEAWVIGQRAGLDPTLILAIMAVESSFNPFAQSPVGAQGLMQVMTRVHDAKYEAFGGTHAAFDPVSNLRVGVQVLKECIARAGNLHDGLRYYVGAGGAESDGGYVGRVLAEQAQMRGAAGGKAIPYSVPAPRAKEVAAPAHEPTPAPTGEQVAMLR